MKILIQIQNSLAVITLNNPDKSNAIDVEMRDTLIQAIHDCNENPDVRIIILNANGKNFCAGADLNHMNHMKTVSHEENLLDAQKFAQLFYTLYSCKKPTICCAQGKTIGGGLGLLSACDIAIATHDATFCFSEVKIGLVPAVISPFILQRINLQSAKYFMMIAETFDTHKALKMGVIDHVTEKSLWDAGLLLAESLLKNNQHAMHETKQWLHTLRPVTQSHMNQAAALLAKMRHLNTHSAN